MKGWQEQCPECGGIDGHYSYCLIGHIEAEMLRRFRLVVLRWALVVIGFWLIAFLVVRWILNV